MTFLIATLAYPALLAVLALGTGLLVERAAGVRVPSLLLVPLGLAGLVVVAQLVTLLSATAPLTPAVLALCAVAGLGAGRRRLRSLAAALRANPWPALAAVAVYAMACAPVVLAGRVTEAGYLLDTTAAIQMAGADRLVTGGVDFGELAASGYRLQLEAYFGAQYPSGAHTLFGGSARLVGVDLVWLYQPFLAAMLALCVPSLILLARRSGVSAGLAPVAAAVAATGALVYAYALMGAIKEIALLPVLLLLAALVVEHRAWLGRGVRAAAPVVVAGAGGTAVVGLAFGAWLALAAVIAVVTGAAAVRAGKLAPPALARQVAAAAAVFAILALPTLVDLGASADLAGSLSQGNAAAAADPGNLLQPIHAAQSAGVWLHGSHRVDPPDQLTLTYGLIGVFVLATLLGIAALIRRRAWTMLALASGMGLVWWLLTLRGTDWTDAKLVVLISPLVVLLAFAGASALIAGGRRVEGALLAATLCVGVIWSDALTYHDTNLAPTERFEELARIGERFAGRGPALLPDFDEYGLYLARRLDVSAPGYANKPTNLARQVGGDPTGYGRSVDLDDLPLRSVRAYPLLVVRRSPEQSHPPTGYRRAYAGRHYDVWLRGAAARSVIAHVGSGGDGRAAARPRCARVRRLATRARDAGGLLRYVERPPATVVDVGDAALTSAFAAREGAIEMRSAGRLDMTIELPRGGRALAWLKGNFSRPTQLLLDDRVVGEVAYESGGDGNYATALPVVTRAGRQRLALRRGGGSWRPGDNAPASIRQIVFESAGEQRVVDVAPARWRAVCATTVDWVEAVRPVS